MKICLVSSSYPDVPCGVGDYTAVLARALGRHEGTSVDVITSDLAAIRRNDEPGVNVVPRLRNWGFGELPELLRAIRSSRPDVVHIQYPAAGYANSRMVPFLPLAIRAKLEVKTAVTVHEWSARSLRGKLATALLACLADRVSMPDEVERHRMVLRFPVLRRKVRVVGQFPTIGVAERVDISAVREALGAGDETLVLSFFGLIKPVHRLEFLFELLEELLGRGVPASLLLIGGVAQYTAAGERRLARLRELAAAKRLSTRVSWTGYLSAQDVSAHLLASDVCVLPFEGGVSMRSTTFHAVRCHGVPLITTLGANTPSRAVHQYRTVHFVREAEFTPGRIADLVLSLDLRRPTNRRIVKDDSIQSVCREHLQMYRELLLRGEDAGRPNAVR
jgi:glycosyltransferase involved in cell wall biosynthesis